MPVNNNKSNIEKYGKNFSRSRNLLHGVEF